MQLNERLFYSNSVNIYIYTSSWDGVVFIETEACVNSFLCQRLVMIYCLGESPFRPKCLHITII